MALDIDPAITTVRDTMLRDITGDPTDIVTTVALIGGTGTGGTTAGIGIEIGGADLLVATESGGRRLVSPTLNHSPIVLVLVPSYSVSVRSAR